MKVKDKHVSVQVYNVIWINPSTIFDVSWVGGKKGLLYLPIELK